MLKALNELAPLDMAAPWDNVGLLLDCPNEGRWAAKPQDLKIFLTNDLTEAVAEEAIQAAADLVVTYHPTPFGKTNKLKREEHVDRVTIAMVSHRIPVYSPHTAYDCVCGGVNDWLIDAFPGVADREPVEPLKMDPTAGFGRVGNLPKALTMEECAALLKARLGVPTLRRADAQNVESLDVTRVAVCAGSGGSVFKSLFDMGKALPQLVVSGEMSHHDVLHLNQNGISVLLAEHTNTERGFLPTVALTLGEKLTAAGLGAQFLISKIDKDPLYVV